MDTLIQDDIDRLTLAATNDLNPLFQQIDSHYSTLNERIIALKAEFRTLKEQILFEKEQWMNELKETVQLERELKERQQKHTDDSDYKRRIELFKDFMFFTQSSKNLERYVQEHNYEQWLRDVENKCNMELEKIRHSMTRLKPLKEIASTWILEDVGDGDYGKTEKLEDSSENEATDTAHYSECRKLNSFEQ